MMSLCIALVLPCTFAWSRSVVRPTMVRTAVPPRRYATLLFLHQKATDNATVAPAAHPTAVTPNDALIGSSGSVASTTPANHKIQPLDKEPGKSSWRQMVEFCAHCQSLQAIARVLTVALAVIYAVVGTFFTLGSPMAIMIFDDPNSDCNATLFFYAMLCLGPSLLHGSYVLARYVQNGGDDATAHHSAAHRVIRAVRRTVAVVLPLILWFTIERAGRRR